MKPPVKKEEPDRSRRINQIIARLKKVYPDAKTELHFSSPLELLVATMLSAQCTDVLVNRSTPELFARYRTTADYAAASLPEMQSLLNKINFYRGKAKNIKATAQILVEKQGGKVPQTMEELIELPGVGRKTANVVLGNAFHIQVGVVVDTHVARLSQRFGLTRHHDPVKIEQVLMKLVPKEEWTIFSHWLIFHGRRRCYARNPDCLGCELKDLCPSFPTLSKRQKERITKTKK